MVHGNPCRTTSGQSSPARLRSHRGPEVSTTITCVHGNPCATREHLVELGKTDLLPQDDEAAIGQLTAVGFDVVISARRRLEFEAASFAMRPFCKSIANIDSVTKTTGMAREATVRLVLRAKDPLVKAPPLLSLQGELVDHGGPGFHRRHDHRLPSNRTPCRGPMRHVRSDAPCARVLCDPTRSASCVTLLTRVPPLLKKALKAFDIPTDFEEWTALAKNRNEWKYRTRPQENDPHTT